MRFAVVLAFAALVALTCALPVGVAPEDGNKYSNKLTFQCLDGSRSLPAGLVNDDYCDCADGSDEPGTSACNFRFYCPNDGHTPLTILSSRVNDGVCDCCDGSDEARGFVRCENTCHTKAKVLAEEARKKDEERRRGLGVKAERAAQGAGRRQQREQSLAQLEQQMKVIQDEVDLLRQAKEKLEDAEREEKQRRKEAKEAELKAKEEAAAAEQPADGPKPEGETENGDNASNQEEFPEENEHSDLGNEEEYPDEKEDGDLQDREEYPEDQEHTDPDEEESPEGMEYDDHDEDSADAKEEAKPAPVEQEYSDPEAEEARKKYREKESEYDTARRNADNIRTELGVDYGKENEFFYLRETCIDFNGRDYKFQLCPFRDVKQIPRDGGSEISLGRFEKWEQTDYGNYGSTDLTLMKYTQGTQCWNGPARSTTVRVICGPEDKVLSVDEPSMCAYTMKFSTPAACV